MLQVAREERGLKNLPAGPYADLEIRILGRESEGYPVEITFTGDREFPRGYLDSTILPWKGRASAADEGAELFQWLFRSEALKEAWIEARGQSLRRRLRLRIDEAAPELHTLPWEALQSSTEEMAEQWAADAETPFSRYLAGRWQPGRPVIERPVKVLVAIANPEDLDDYGLASLDVDAERRALEDAVAEVDGSELELTFMEQPVTLASLDAELRRGFHILHVVAHGVSPEDEPAALFLSDADHQAVPVEQQELAAMVERQSGSLRLVYLSSCQSARRHPSDAFRGLAPALIQAGIPAVLAMQDLVAIDTARAFSATFYRRLLAHGMVDLAANEARSTILSAGLPGAAIPVLFLRLRSGRLFGQRGQVVGKQGESFWNILLENIADGECTPILGPGIAEDLVPIPTEIARHLAREHGYPLSDEEQLPRVAQFVGTIDNVRLRKAVVRQLVVGFKRRLGQRPNRRDRRAGLSKTLVEVDWPELSRELGETEIHHQLADLELPLYLTTNFDNFMSLALEGGGRKVRREILPWHQPIFSNELSPFLDFDPPPCPEQPVVLHLFGTDEDLLSMVLTEDDHLDFLARVSRDHQHMVPTSVGEALARNTLLFLGYRLQDLDLKVLLRGLLSTLDLTRWGRYHVAVQIESDARDGDRQEDVQRYFQKYFGSSQIDVYWGSTQQFVSELHSRWESFLDG